MGILFRFFYVLITTVAVSLLKHRKQMVLDLDYRASLLPPLTNNVAVSLEVKVRNYFSLEFSRHCS